MPDTAIPYEQDWYAWTQDQAARLRAWPEALRPNGLDIANLAEEVADMGGSQRRTVQSLLYQALLHLLKIEFHPAPATARHHWAAELANCRTLLEIEFRDSPSLRARRQDFVDAAWPRALRQLRRQLREEAPDRLPTLDAATRADAPRYDADRQVLDEEWLPPAA
ncbi:DUF29 domain-containing protein [Falsiroseomonas selenitidurans]|uniref:DUF29 domain-containing protein n=1 Tax=Falsiroseomonas selenitidurans TaxID=2716335 RepID=A0ABX1E356_9PROT|nr:DUF29 domain-containing protein [Falsiroseomonas selenitidurans]NKC29947.1 DUF29 domain-containing protein [Falsiroseomonas selenitidurans]